MKGTELEILEMSMKKLKADHQHMLAKCNELIKEHNILVDEHTKLLEQSEDMLKDNKALLQLIISLSRGLALFAEQSHVFRTAQDLNPIVLKGEARLDSGRMFCADMHNEIINLISQMSKGKRVSEVYEDWIKACQAINNQTGGMFS